MGVGGWVGGWGVGGVTAAPALCCSLLGAGSRGERAGQGSSSSRHVVCSTNTRISIASMLTCMIGIATERPTPGSVTAAMQAALPQFQHTPAAMPGAAARLLVACRAAGAGQGAGVSAHKHMRAAISTALGSSRGAVWSSLLQRAPTQLSAQVHPTCLHKAHASTLDACKYRGHQRRHQQRSHCTGRIRGTTTPLNVRA